MPSVEIACIGLTKPLPPPKTTFAVEFEAGLRSHRSPSPLFQEEFNALSGSLYHLGNPDLAQNRDGSFFAYELLTDASRNREPPLFLEFASAHLESVRSLVGWLLDTSPVYELLFTSDWQFGPETAERYDAVSLSEFWRLHDAQSIRLNAAYPISRAAKQAVGDGHGCIWAYTDCYAPLRSSRAEGRAPRQAAPLNSQSVRQTRGA